MTLLKFPVCAPRDSARGWIWAELVSVYTPGKVNPQLG